jgi:hypothetical protein
MSALPGLRPPTPRTVCGTAADVPAHDLAIWRYHQVGQVGLATWHGISDAPWVCWRPDVPRVVRSRVTG